MAKPTAVAVFCGASSPKHPGHKPAIEGFGRGLAERGIELVYGGGNLGLMGAVTGATLDAGGRVYGVIPRILHEREQAHPGVQELVTVETMHERKFLMYQRAQVFVIYPGGYGTMDEFFEVLTWRQIGIQDKPILVVDLDGYFSGLRQWIQRAHDDGLLAERYLGLVHFVDGTEAALACLDELAEKNTAEALAGATVAPET